MNQLSQSEAESDPADHGPLTVSVIGGLSLALSMGIGRFAFTPILPLMTRESLLLPDQGTWLAAGNYLGYLLGAMFAGRIQASPTQQMKLSWIGIVFVTACMGFGHSLLWWIMWRFLAGLFSAYAMIGTSAWVLPAIAKSKQSALAGIVYAGVGIGIAGTGGFCLLAVAHSATSQQTWIGLSGLALGVALVLSSLIGGHHSMSPRRAVPSEYFFGKSSLIVLCYGFGGFGYILPATFLPAMARTLIDDPIQFGIAWPIFGAAAACSTILAAYAFSRVSRLKMWSISNVVMAIGTILPCVWPTLLAIEVAALLVGGTFVIVTMTGLQEARARSPKYPTLILSRMTAAFGAGQILGPALTGTLAHFHVRSALSLSLQIAAVVLLIAAWLLWPREISKGHGISALTSKQRRKSIFALQ